LNVVGLWHRCLVIRLVAEEPTVSLDDRQVKRITFLILEFVPARGCQVRREPPVGITISGHDAPELHPPLLEQIEAIAGCRFQVTTFAG
jgi:hypothetical protein